METPDLDAGGRESRSKWRRRALAAAILVSLLVLWTCFLLPASHSPPQVPNTPGTPEDPNRPYTANSPWNTVIPAGAPADVGSDAFIAAFTGRKLTSDPTQYSFPVYIAANATANRTVAISGRFSDVHEPGDTLTNQAGGTVSVPIPGGASPAAGTDGQLVVLNPGTGDEWGFWQAAVQGDGSWAATNGYHYNTRWSGVPPTRFVSRGAGVPYFAGLVRPWEIEAGRIAHALAFGYDYPSPEFVFPATKSDGNGISGIDIPEGGRLQLDPSLTEADFESWGLSASGKVIAKALQEYGMIVIDNAGRPKVYMEGEDTAHWNGTITANTVSPIPLPSFRVLNLLQPIGQAYGGGTRSLLPGPVPLAATAEGVTRIPAFESTRTTPAFKRA